MLSAQQPQYQNFEKYIPQTSLQKEEEARQKVRLRRILSVQTFYELVDVGVTEGVEGTQGDNPLGNISSELYIIEISNGERVLL